MKTRILTLTMITFLLLTPAVGSSSGAGPDNETTDPYEILFSLDKLHDIEIVISQEEWDGISQDMKDYAANDPSNAPRVKLQTGNYRKAHFIYTGPSGDTEIEEIGFRTKGRSGGRRIPQDENGTYHRSHFKVKFNETFNLEKGTDEYDERDDRRFCRLRSLILRLPIDPTEQWDDSQIRELYCYDLMRRAGAYTSRTGSVRLFITIDGEKHYYGIYTLLEPINKSFLTKRYGKDGNDGNLYKCVNGSAGPSSLQLPNVNTSYWYRQFFPDREIAGVKDWETYYYPTYDLKTNEEEADHSALLDFIEKLNSLTDDDFKNYMNENFEIDRFLRYQAMNVLMGKWDDYWTMGNNYYLYFHNDGKIEFITTDYDMAIGGGNLLFYSAATGIYEWDNHFAEFLSLMTPYTLEFFNNNFNFASPLVEKIFEIEEYRSLYERYFEEFIRPENSLFLYSDYVARFKKLQDLYSEYLDNDVDEGEEMLNEEKVGKYFYEKTMAVINELDLEEDGYETTPSSLDPPTGVLATQGTSDSHIIVSWESVNFADYYQVLRACSPETEHEIIADNLTDTTHTDGPLAPDSTCFYRIRGLIREGTTSDLSSEVSGATNDGSITIPERILVSSGTYQHLISLMWEPVLNADSYDVCRADISGGSCELISDNSTLTNYTDKSVAANTTYYYRVRAGKDEGVLSEFSEEVPGASSDDGLVAPQLIEALPLVSGTYSHTYSYGTDTYTFYSDGTCKKSYYNPTDPSQGKAQGFGEWYYDENGRVLTIDTAAKVTIINLTIRNIEVWQNVFTTNNGSILHLMGLKKTTGDMDLFSGNYESSGSLNVALSGFLDINQFLDYEGTVTVNDNGTISGTLSRPEDVINVSETWDNSDNNLLAFKDEYFLPSVEGNLLFYRQEVCPLETALRNAKHLNTLRRLRDTRLHRGNGRSLAKLYYTHAAEISNILASDETLRDSARSLIAGTMKLINKFMVSGQIVIDITETKNIAEFLEKLSYTAEPRLKQDIKYVLEKIRDNSLLKGVMFGN